MTFFFFFVFTIQGHNPCLAVQLACNWVTRQPWLEAAVVRGPHSSARARSGKGQGHHFQSVDMTLMGYDREEATRFAMPHNICNLPLLQYACWSYWAVTRTHTHTHTRTHTPRQLCPVVISSSLLLFCHPIIHLSLHTGWCFVWDVLIPNITSSSYSAAAMLMWKSYKCSFKR